MRDGVVVDGIGKTYASGVEAVREARFSVVPGEFLSLLGPSGCGKSTLLMLIAGLLAPSRGRIQVAGAEVRGPRRDVGIVFQSPVLLPWRTVLDNVLLPVEMLRLRRGDYERRARDLLAMAGVHDFAAKLPHELSGGMKQRVAICRALVHDPALLLMDEPFSALDALTRDQMGLELLRIWDVHKKTVVFVTHSIREAVFLSDRVLVMTPRPATIGFETEVKLPRPRTMDLQEADDFNRYVGLLRQAIEAGARA
ncbi:MAG TPA: ABC transporter ATP-binding protein [Methylomirabilota bacterium]|nr:ABC transporter ATP-binding protein [Methylomirabilota bacterium]